MTSKATHDLSPHVWSERTRAWKNVFTVEWLRT